MRMLKIRKLEIVIENMEKEADDLSLMASKRKILIYSFWYNASPWTLFSWRGVLFVIYLIWCPRWSPSQLSTLSPAPTPPSSSPPPARNSTMWDVQVGQTLFQRKDATLLSCRIYPIFEVIGNLLLVVILIGYSLGKLVIFLCK